MKRNMLKGKVQERGKIRNFNFTQIFLVLLLFMMSSTLKVRSQSSITLDDISISSIRQQAEAGNVGLQFILGYYYNNGKRVKKDLQQAKYWYEKAVAGGHQDAKPLLALIYDGEENYAKAYSLFLSYIENPQNDKKTDVNSLYNMSIFRVGHYKSEGRGTIKDIKGAVEWLEKARAGGYSPVLTQLYACYSEMKEWNKMFTIANEMYSKVGYPGFLAYSYLYGIGCQQELNKVYELVSDLANGQLEYVGTNGSSLRVGKSSQYRAQLYMGVANYFDKSKSNHYQESVRWLKSVINSTDAQDKDKGEALCLLQRCYRFGRGVEKDLAKAALLETEYKKYLSEEEYMEFMSHFAASY